MRWSVVLLVLAMVAAACSGGSANDDRGIGSGATSVASSTTEPVGGPEAGGGSPDDAPVAVMAAPNYWVLDLSTPETAVDAFVTTFGSGDFVTSFLLIHADTQRSILGLVVRRDLEALVREEGVEAGGAAFDELFTRSWRLPAGLSMFDVVMTSAATEGAMVVDMMEGVEDLVTVTQDSTTARVEGSLVATLETVTFEMATAPSGRWRVVSASVPGGDVDDVVLFGGPRDGSSTPVAADRLVAYRDLLGLDSPTSAVAAAIASFEAQNWVALYNLLSYDGQLAIFTGISNLQFDVFLGPMHGFAALESLEIGVNEHADAELLIDTLFRSVSSGALAFDLAGGEITDERAGPDSIEGQTVIVTVSAPAGGFDVTLVQDDLQDWRVRSIHEAGIVAGDYAVFLASPDGMEIPEGAVVCPSWIVVWSCQLPELPAEFGVPGAELQAEVERLTDLAQSDPANAAVYAAQIAELMVGDPEQLDIVWTCQAMQRLTPVETARRVDIGVARWLATNYCPGDPDLVAVSG